MSPGSSAVSAATAHCIQAPDLLPAPLLVHFCPLTSASNVSTKSTLSSHRWPGQNLTPESDPHATPLRGHLHSACRSYGVCNLDMRGIPFRSDSTPHKGEWRQRTWKQPLPEEYSSAFCVENLSGFLYFSLWVNYRLVRKKTKVCFKIKDQNSKIFVTWYKNKKTQSLPEMTVNIFPFLNHEIPWFFISEVKRTTVIGNLCPLKWHKSIYFQLWWNLPIITKKWNC